MNMKRAITLSHTKKERANIVFSFSKIIGGRLYISEQPYPTQLQSRVLEGKHKHNTNARYVYT